MQTITLNPTEPSLENGFTVLNIDLPEGTQDEDYIAALEFETPEGMVVKDLTIFIDGGDEDNLHIEQDKSLLVYLGETLDFEIEGAKEFTLLCACFVEYGNSETTEYDYVEGLKLRVTLTNVDEHPTLVTASVLDAFKTPDDVLVGSANDDVLRGKRGDDKLDGGDGDDLLKGGKGHDTLFGGAGDDLLKGGKGHDTLLGGMGTDTLKVVKGATFLLSMRPTIKASTRLSISRAAKTPSLCASMRASYFGSVGATTYA